MIMKTLSPETRAYHTICDLAEEYGIDAVLDAVNELIKDIIKAKEQ